MGMIENNEGEIEKSNIDDTMIDTVDNDNKAAKIAESFWLDTRGFTNAISIPNILLGSFFGAIITVATIFTPFFLDEEYNAPPMTPTQIQLSKSVEESIREKVMLFSDILEDLQAGYVDPINPTKLFETAVGAMLKSLDPYTEFENLGAAKMMQESVSGRYGGVGLVISANKVKISGPTVSLKDPKVHQNGVDKTLPSPTQEINKESDNIESDISKNVKDGTKSVTIVDAFEVSKYSVLSTH